MLKGIKCAECGNVFKWSELSSEDKIGRNGCICPHCKASIKTVFPVGKLAALLLFGVCYSALVFFSISHFSQRTTQVLGISEVIAFLIIPRIIFKNGLVSTASISTPRGQV